MSVKVFTGNTSNTKTFASQVRKVAERFGGGAVTFVGDRGMIRNRQIEEVGLYMEEIQINGVAHAIKYHNHERLSGSCWMPHRYSYRLSFPAKG